jgi:hypothetical protein
MTDRPIIFSAPMVRALLEGRKSQTRRTLKPQPKIFQTDEGPCEVALLRGMNDPLPRVQLGRVITPQQIRFAVGDRLWVRENWRPVGDAPLSQCVGPEDVRFAASATEEEYACFKWRPSIHMPRWASRLTLIVTDVRIEQLQNISEDDARAEGCFVGKATGRIFESATSMRLGGNEWATARDWYADLWESINGQDAWKANPWIVAVSFTTRLGNIDHASNPSLKPRH